ncbi:MAG: pectin acetylesterase-family hydrolase, partial [Myxococcaceae bacterium]
TASAGGAASAGGSATAGGAPNVSDGGTSGWSFFAVAGAKCATGAPAGIGYNAGITDELVVFVQGGGACWNNGMCRPSVYQWGPVCNYGMNSVCLVDIPGSTQPTAVYVTHPDPFPGDGGGAFATEIATVKNSVLFSRRVENPFASASWAFVPYCTGDLHAGNTTRTYNTKGGLLDPVVPRTHYFAGATNMDAYLAWLRARHASVRTLWLIGVSGGGYGAQLNLHRVKQAFPEAQVQLLADSAPMVNTPYFDTARREWNLQVPTACTTCDAGFPAIIEHQIVNAPTTRVALLSFTEDQVITRFFFAPGTTAGWATPPTSSYVAALNALEPIYEAHSNSKFFRRPGQEHVMLDNAGLVRPDGGLTPSISSPDGGITLKAWIDAWATGMGTWESQR